ncbi:MAG: hypothetical protein ABMA25_05570 [Ilumatobacteraceae bacterium]
MFDVVIIVDWSAAVAPKRGADSIWSYELGDGRTDLINHPTRAEARAHLSTRLLQLAGRRVLVGFDFAFAYPAGFAAAASLTAPGVPAWRAVWQHVAGQISDDDRNRNNRWSVAAELNERLGSRHFWGAPPASAGPHLTSTKPASFALAEYRRSEAHLREVTGKRPFSAWQLLGAGAVGSQTLMGIPTLHHLRHHEGLAERTRVWPFETGFTTDPWAARPDGIVLAEVWPSAVEFGHVTHPVKDARQVIALAQRLRTSADDGSLAVAFSPPSRPADEAAALEEGWVLTP